MFNRKSSYALNKKDPNAIVYMDANEAIIRLTREDFASEKEFLKWKALSDEDYHASEKEAHVYANHTLALDELSRGSFSGAVFRHPENTRRRTAITPMIFPAATGFGVHPPFSAFWPTNATPACM